MKNVFVVVMLLVSILFTTILPANAQEYATCDQCGYCQGQTPPTNWDKCRDCLYNVGGAPATSNETLKLGPPGPFEDIVPTTVPGNYYTGVGCVRTGGFTKSGSAGAVSQAILNVIFSVAGGIAFLYILFGAFQVATSQNNPERLNYGKRLIIGSIIGLIISLSAVFLVNIIGGQVLKIPGFGS